METCKNCGTISSGTYCTACGQKSNAGQITFRELSSDFLSTVVDFDAPLYKTIGELFIRPAKLIHSYIRGKRKSYYNPIRYLIFSMALYLLTKVLIDFDPVATFNAMQGIDTGNTVPASSTSDPSIDAGQFFSRNINILIFILSFVLAIVAKIFFWKERVRLAEYLALGFYVVGHYMLAGTFIILISQINPKLYILNYLFVLGYFSYVLILFHEGHWAWKSLKALLTVLLSYFLFAFLGFSISAFILNTFY